MSAQKRTYARRDVVSLGFEACCIDAHGARWLWHDDMGVRADPSGLVTTLITDPARLPEGPWVLTDLGQRELRDGEIWR